MYSAEQIRKKVYIPDTSEGLLNEDDILTLIILADSSGKKSIRVRNDTVCEGVEQICKFSGYNVESVSFLGSKFLQISW